MVLINLIMEEVCINYQVFVFYFLQTWFSILHSSFRIKKSGCNLHSSFRIKKSGWRASKLKSQHLLSNSNTGILNLILILGVIPRFPTKARYFLSPTTFMK